VPKALIFVKNGMGLSKSEMANTAKKKAEIQNPRIVRFKKQVPRNLTGSTNG
jgi:hypothetical protein